MDIRLPIIIKFFVLLLLSQYAAAKVAYLPLIEVENNAYIINDLGVYDLELGTEIKRINIAQGGSAGFESGNAVFLNNTESIVYVGVDRSIIAVDTSKLEIIKTWDNLPVKVSRIFLSEDNQTLYFIMLEPGPDELKLFKINLSTDEVNSVFDHPDEVSTFVYHSPNLEYMAVSYHHSVTDESRIMTYRTNDLTLLYDFEPESGAFISLIDDNENFYQYEASNAGGVVSRSLVDGVENWSFYEPDDPYYFAAMEFNDQYMVQLGLYNYYLIDKTSGESAAYSSVKNNAPFGIIWGFELIEHGQMILVEIPDTWCEFNICTLTSHLSIMQVDLFNNSGEQLYLSDSWEGSLPFGRFIGERRYVRGSVQAVPFANPGILLMLMGLVIFMGYRYKVH